MLVQAISTSPRLVSGAILLAVFIVWKLLSTSKKSYTLPTPPVVRITNEKLLQSPIASILEAFEKHGPIIALTHSTSTEYIVGEEYTRTVLMDDSRFSFEHGISMLLGMGWIRRISGFYFQDIDMLAREFVSLHLNDVMPNVWNILEQSTKDIVDTSGVHEAIDILPHVQQTMAKVTSYIFLGEEYNDPEIIDRLVNIAEDIAELLGLFKNQSALARLSPTLWRACTWLKIVLIKLPYHLGWTLARRLWHDISIVDDKAKRKTVLTHLTQEFKSQGREVNRRSKISIMMLVLTIIFASLHQTVTIIIWVTYFLALHPESQQALKEEHGKLSQGQINVQTLRDAPLADSFVREVLCMKGDAVNVARCTRKDVVLGGYCIPAGSLVMPFTHHSYRSESYTDCPNEFRPERWVDSGKQAAMTGPGYLPFGLGKWSCPGRVLASAEIKMWVLAMAKATKFRLEGNSYRILDHYNISSFPPEGRLVLDKGASL